LVAGVTLSDDQRLALTAAGLDILADATTPEQELAAAIEQAVVWFGPKLNAGRLARASNLLWLQSDTVGLDHYMFPELANSKVLVSCVRGKHTSASEQALAFVLAIARFLPAMLRQQDAKVWKQPTNQDVKTLIGSRMVVAGTGVIGSDIARKAAAFGVIVAGVNLDGSPADPFHEVVATDQLAKAVKGADWVVNALPFAPGTVGIISEEVIAQMDAGAVFINIGRGGTVDQAALISALQRGHLSAAGLDVFESEPLPADSPLWSMPNVIVTPHMAGVIPGRPGHQAGVEFLIENMSRLDQGLEIAGLIDKQLGF
jgi:phosphoglycerate dehydrogenase-like enzyme